MFKYKFLLLTLTLSTIFCIRSIAKDFYITNGNVYGTNGLVEAIRAAKDNNDLINTIHLANGGSYVLDRIIEEAPEGLGPNGLPVWRTDSNTNKVLIFKGNGATISRSASAPIFRMMFVYNHADVQADNVTFTNFRTNTRGGGVFYIKYGGTGKFTNCKFPNNQTVSISALYGGSLFIDILGSLEIDRCEFTDNRCWGEGGAVYCVGSDLKVTNSTFLRNKSLNPNSNNNDYYVNGGAIQVDGVNNERTKKVTISNCVFDGNEVGDQGKEQGGGAVFIFLYDDQQFEMDRCTFKNNKSGGFGGGLSASATLANPNAYIKITNSVFHNNRTEGQGGAMWMICKKADIVNCTVSQNYSDEYGGGIAIINQGKTVVKHCTIDNNDCRLSGGGLFCSERSLELYNSIVAFNTVKGANYIAANCREFYQGSGNIEYPQIINNVNAVNCGSNVTIADPKLLALADNGGGTMTKALSATSPAINKANNSFTTPTDQRGTNRQGLPDIGAYEYSTTSTTPPDVIGAGVTINKLVLINTATGQAVPGHDPLLSGAQINLATVNPSQLSIQAFTSSAPQKVNFNLAGAATWNQTEGAAPYFLFGDVNASGSPWKATVPKAGDNFTLTVTPYNLDGTAGPAQVVSFSFVNTTAPPPPPTSTAPIVNSVSVINTLTNQPIPGYENLQDGTQFNLSTLPTTKISFKVNTSNAGSVDLNLSGSATWQQVESVQPFSMFGDNANGLIPWPIKPITAGDNYKLVITPYSGAGKLGTKGAVKEINFTFVSGEVTPPPPPPPSSGLSVSSMTLINALTDQEIKTLQNGETIDLASLPTNQLNIRANVSGGSAGSVVLESFGPVNSLRNENGAPYAMFGDAGGDYYGQTFSAGQYTFKATPYSQPNSSGNTGTSLSLNITFSNGGGTPPPPPPPPTGSTGDFIENNGLVMMEVEAVPLQTGWKQGSSGGVTFYEATVNSVSSPGAGILNYNIQINNPGIYRLVARTRINIGTDGTEHNDTWIKLPNSTDATYFAYKGTPSDETTLQNALNSNTVLYPNGIGKGPNPAGASTSGYFKVYMNTVGAWLWRSVTSDFDPHDIYVKFAKAGTYTLQLSNRSAGHALDRVVLYRINNYGYNYNGNLELLTNVPQSARVGSTLNRVAATELNSVKENLIIYPNPSVQDGQITITNPSKTASKVQVVLLDRLGKVIYKAEQMLEVGQNAEIDLSKLNLQKGSYTLSYDNGIEKKVETIVIR